MWIWMAVCSAFLLGFYDVAKKQALKNNGVLEVLLVATAISTVFLSPFLIGGGVASWMRSGLGLAVDVADCGWQDHLRLVVKACIVSISWISGLAGMKLLPITTASAIKASRPMFVVLFSILLFGERLNAWQWGGVVLALVAMWMLSLSSKKEGISFSRNRGVFYMALSVLAGVISALYDKHIIRSMDPMFVQSWGNFYITLLLAAVVGVRILAKKAEKPLRWDWTLLLVAVLITISDAMYFLSLKQDGALLSVISLIRRASVVVTFILGAILFKERNIRSKAVDLLVLLAGMVLLLIGSR